MHNPDTILALDVGQRRIGYALANVVAKLPSPEGVVENSDKVMDAITALVKEHGAVAVVVGLPRNLEGNDTDQTRLTRQFVDDLKKILAVPIHLQDEALTSHAAEQELGLKKVVYNKGSVDALAATYILADFLNDHPNFPNE